METHSAITGELGLEMDYSISKNINLVTSMSYRVLKIDQTIKAFGPGYKPGDGYWESGTGGDLSGFTFGADINYGF